MSYTNPNAASAVFLRIPMPVRGSTEAPVFDGKGVHHFLCVLIQLGANAGIMDHDELVPYILWYSSDEVREVIRYMPEFDEDVPNKEWTRAQEMLISLYGSMDTPTRVTEENLREYCRSSYAQPAFASKQAVDLYHRGFQSLSAPLVKHGLLSPTQRDFYFITGIPEPLRDWYFHQVPESKLSRTNPPSVLESISYLYSRFDTESIIFEPSEPALHIPTQTSHSYPAESQQHIPNTSLILLDELSRGVAESVIKLVQEQEKEIVEAHQHERMYVRDHVTGFRRCFVCGKSGEELKHPLHPLCCPETRALLGEGLISFDRSNARYTLANGGELSNVRGFHGGVAAFLRLTARAESRARSHFCTQVEPLNMVSDHRVMDLQPVSSSSMPTMWFDFAYPPVTEPPIDPILEDEEEVINTNPEYTDPEPFFSESEDQTDLSQVFETIMHSTISVPVSVLLNQDFLICDSNSESAPVSEVPQEAYTTSYIDCSHSDSFTNNVYHLDLEALEIEAAKYLSHFSCPPTNPSKSNQCRDLISDHQPLINVFKTRVIQSFQ